MNMNIRYLYNEEKLNIRPLYEAVFEDAVCRREEDRGEEEEYYSRYLKANDGVVNVDYSGYHTVKCSEYREEDARVFKYIFSQYFEIHTCKILSELYANDTTNMNDLQDYFVNFYIVCHQRAKTADFE